MYITHRERHTSINGHGWEEDARKQESGHIPGRKLERPVGGRPLPWFYLYEGSKRRIKSYKLGPRTLLGPYRKRKEILRHLFL